MNTATNKATAKAATKVQAPVELDGKDLPAHCPNPLMPTWSSHPRVFLNLDSSGSAKCPYCGTQYRLKPGAVVKGH